MSKLIFTLSISIAFFLTACDTYKVDSVPDCIESQLKLTANACTDGKATVYAYNFHEERVYILSPGNCMRDGGAHVITETCEKLCFLGGFDGNLICQGDTFDKVATDMELVWEEE